MKAKIFMAKVIKLILGLCLLAAPGARAFSLLGPFPPWQVQALTYQWPGIDIGGPMNIGEGFRWNVPVITYAYDRSFIDYFGDEGVEAIDEAMRILNEVMPASKISLDLSEYSTQTLRENYEAETLGLLDLKSTALHLLVEELGLADPVRFTYTLRGRATGGNPLFTNYVTAFRNFDPVTREVSRYVNGTLYTFEIQEFAQPFQHADAVEFPAATGTEALENVPVATGGARIGSTGPNASVAVGRFRVGLSRDDVGGLRYLYHKNNYAVEDLLPNITLGRRLDSAWQPFVNITNFVGVTNQFLGTNGLTNVVSTGLRGGKNKLHFRKVLFDSVLGTTLTPITNAYTDVVVSTNSTLVVQPVLRPITVPDIIFSAGDLGLTAPPNIRTVITRRTGTANWVDNDALNGFDEVGAEARGPGVIVPSITISFSDQLPSLVSSDNAFLGVGSGEDFSFNTGYWGSFDGSTNPPVIFSKFRVLSIQQLRSQILGGAPQ
jgi:hypothetical protein